jgi:hypothetical protein
MQAGMQARPSPFGDRDDDPFFEDQRDAPSTKEQPSQPWSDRELPSDANTNEDKPVPQDIQQDNRPSTYRRRSGNMRQGQAPSASQEGQGPSGILEDQQAPKEEQQAPKEEQQAPKDTTDSQVTDAGRCGGLHHTHCVGHSPAWHTVSWSRTIQGGPLLFFAVWHLPVVQP